MEGFCMGKRIFQFVCLLFVFILLNEFTHYTPIITYGPPMLFFLGAGLIILAGSRKNPKRY